jgi:hypothetical protein
MREDEEKKIPKTNKISYQRGINFHYFGVTPIFRFSLLLLFIILYIKGIIIIREKDLKIAKLEKEVEEMMQKNNGFHYYHITLFLFLFFFFCSFSFSPLLIILSMQRASYSITQCSFQTKEAEVEEVGGVPVIILSFLFFIYFHVSLRCTSVSKFTFMLLSPIPYPLPFHFHSTLLYSHFIKRYTSDRVFSLESVFVLLESVVLFESVVLVMVVTAC